MNYADCHLELRLEQSLATPAAFTKPTEPADFLFHRMLLWHKFGSRGYRPTNASCRCAGRVHRQYTPSPEPHGMKRESPSFAHKGRKLCPKSQQRRRLLTIVWPSHVSPRSERRITPICPSARIAAVVGANETSSWSLRARPCLSWLQHRPTNRPCHRCRRRTNRRQRHWSPLRTQCPNRRSPCFGCSRRTALVIPERVVPLACR